MLSKNNNTTISKDTKKINNKQTNSTLSNLSKESESKKSESKESESKESESKESESEESESEESESKESESEDPLEVSDSPWLYENFNGGVGNVDTGKWMLFYNKSLMNEAWIIAKKLYRENKLIGVKSMKCSTSYENPRASTLEEGIIILYCNNSSNEETIMNIGKKIIEMFDYKEKEIIYYKTDLQTQKGTIATGSNKNHTYKLFNPLYKGKCLIKLQCSKLTFSVEESIKIKRQYPTKKQEKTYPERYNNSVFEKLNKINTDTELQNDYKKLKNGINYKTNRKIKIGGKIHEELKHKFMISYLHNYSFGNQIKLSVLFEDITNINVTKYLQETEKINNDIDHENFLIQDYNKSVDNIIEKIQKLESWNEFIEFEEIKYGLVNKIKNNIHIENNCSGEMILSDKKIEYTFNDRPFCNYEDKETNYLIYKCSKCNYENKIVECITGGSSQYVSKIGLWWK